MFIPRLTTRIGAFTFLLCSVALSPVSGAHHKRGHSTGPSVTEAFKAITPEAVLSVSANSITVGDSKNQTTYQVSFGMGGTEIYVNHVKGTLADIKPGMAVTVSADSSRATTIIANAAVPQKHPKKGSKN